MAWDGASHLCLSALQSFKPSLQRLATTPIFEELQSAPSCINSNSGPRTGSPSYSRSVGNDHENRNWVESSKVAALLLELENLCSVGSKSILFSQWTAFLDLLQIPLSRSDISFVRLDGTLNQQQREKVIKQFSEESNILVLLMSLKVGGVRINLMAVSHAFVLDPWWNPAVEEQAVMCIHRIGQTKRVMVKRFIVKGTIRGVH